MASDNVVTRGVTAASVTTSTQAQYIYPEPRWARVGSTITINMFSTKEVTMPTVSLFASNSRSLTRCVSNTACGSSVTDKIVATGKCSDSTKKTQATCVSPASWTACTVSAESPCTAFVATY